MRYFLTSGSNLELYFSCNQNLYEKGTLHFEAYNNKEMVGFPIIKEEIPNFDLRTAHPSVYGTNKIVTGCNYSGETWWFAWVDIIPESVSENLTLDANGEQGEDLFKYGPKSISDVGGIAYGQNHLSGVNTTSNPAETGRVFFHLTFDVPAFPRFSQPKIIDAFGFRYFIRRASSSKLFEIFSRRPYVCEQDYFLYFNLKAGLKYQSGGALDLSCSNINYAGAFINVNWLAEPSIGSQPLGSSFSISEIFSSTITHYMTDTDLIDQDKSQYGINPDATFGALNADYDRWLNHIAGGPPKFYPTGGPSFEEAYS